MTLVNTRAAFEDVISTNVRNADPSVIIIFDNMPLSTPGKNKKYVMVSLDFGQSTTQTQGAAETYYSGSIRCGIMTPPHKGSAEASAIAETVITGLTSVNASTYTDTFSVSPRVLQIEGPTSVNVEEDSHYLSVISCDFTANA